MEPYKLKFIEFALQNQVLLFGEFTLKSGRKSPYFFNAGQFNSGNAIRHLGQSYASAVQESGIEFDILFGPAYKGIPLVTSLAIALAEQGINKPFCFNRKEKKTHAEGGLIVGAPLQGRALIIDDVISAGLTIHEAVDIIHTANATVAGIVISVDRQERGQNHLSAVQEVKQKYNIPVISIVTLADIVRYLELKQMSGQLEKLRQYQVEYGNV